MWEIILMAAVIAGALAAVFFTGVCVGIAGVLDIIEKERQLNDDYDNGIL